MKGGAACQAAAIAIFRQIENALAKRRAHEGGNMYCFVKMDVEKEKIMSN